MLEYVVFVQVLSVTKLVVGGTINTHTNILVLTFISTRLLLSEKILPDLSLIGNQQQGVFNFGKFYLLYPSANLEIA